MWHTSRGDRTLCGAEAALVRRAIGNMVDGILMRVDEELEDGVIGVDTGIAVYDMCSTSQRVGLLHQVAKHLLTDTDSALVLSAPLEATIAAIFVDIRDQVAMEIEFLPQLMETEDQPTWRRMVLDAYLSTLAPDDLENKVWAEMVEQLPTEDCRFIRRWEHVIDSLADAILWDRDFELADQFLDSDPVSAFDRRQVLGISDDYFTRIAPDPRAEDVRRVVSQTRAIVRRKPR
ncbi:MAG: hypothetical protein P1U77_25570 [Rubripirellula sp.]|nr:hypothetical protein [Rubripirellula sp.]